MSNATEENRQVQTDTRDDRSTRGRPCPSWCVDHDGLDIGHRDELIVHLGSTRQAGSTEVQLRQVEFVDTGELDAVFVRVDDDLIPPITAAQVAAELSAVLVSVAAEAGVR